MSPYKSEAQRKKFHALLSKGKMKRSVVEEFDTASEGKRLPERMKSRSKKRVKRR